VRFRLESILKLKEYEEEVSKEKLASIRREIQKLEEDREKLERERRKLEEELVEGARDGMTGLEISKKMAALKYFEAEIGKIRGELERMRRLEEEALGEFLEKRI